MVGTRLPFPSASFQHLSRANLALVCPGLGHEHRHLPRREGDVAEKVPFQSHPEREPGSRCGSWGGGEPGARRVLNTEPLHRPS